MKKRVLCMTHLPPPINGVTLMGSIVVNSQKLQNAFEVRTIPFKSSDSIDDIGSFNLKKVTRSLYFCWRLLVECLFFRPDLVYFTLTPSGKAFYRDLFYVLIIKLTRRRRIYHLHGKGVTGSTATPLSKFLYKWAFRNCSVILLSPLLYDDISGVVGREQCFYLPNGIPYTFAPDAGVTETVTEIPHILYLSNIVRNKGPLVLLEALAVVHRRGIQFKASFAGVWESSEVEADFYNLVAMNDISRKVNYLGSKFGEEKEKLLESADIFAFPTYNDAYPLVILEAMSHGLPVVSTYEGAIPDMIKDGENGFLVSVKDPAAVADCLLKLIVDPGLRTKMGQAGRERYEQEFTQNVFEQGLFGILSKCVTKKW